MSRRPPDPRKAAEAAFKRGAPRPIEPATGAQRAASLPAAKEQVSLRIDRDVLEFFQAGGTGWQERINEVLRKHAGK